jgi:signal transduction histidine kinase
MRGVLATAQRHRLVVDTGLAALIALGNAPAVAAADAGAVGWLCLAAAHLPLVWRRRTPVAVFWTVFVAALTVWTVARVDEAYPVIVILLAVYTLARHRPRWFLWPAVAAVETTLAATWLSGDLPRSDLVALTAALAAAGLLGLAIRTQRAYVAELEERARRLEGDRDQQAKLAAAAERARIAREMHDIVAHNLTVMVALADGAALSATAAPQRAVDTLMTVAATGRQALGEMQRLVGLLRDGGPAPAIRSGSAEERFAPQPSLDDLDQLVAQLQDAGLRVTLVREGAHGNWGPGAGLAIYRIVQEALTNTLKHAGPAATAQVRLCCTATRVDLDIVDDGPHRPCLTPSGPLTGGHGLAGMIERAAAYGGHVEAGPLPEAGWRVRVRMRLDHVVEGA